MSLADFSAEGGRSAVVRKQPPNTYTAMLLAAVVALAVACLFLFLKLQSYAGMSMSTGVSGDARVSSVPQPSAAPAPTETPDATTPGTGT